MIIPLKKCYAKIKQFTFKSIGSKSDCNVLDIGCGLRGNFWGFAPENYFGIDSNSDVIKKNLIRKNGFYKQHDVCQELPFANAFFDCVVCVSFFHHLRDDQAKQLIIQIKRVLKRDARAIIVDGVFPDSKFNILGYLIRYLDRGKFVRNSDEFEQLFLKEFDVEQKYNFTESIFAYTALLLRPKND